MKDTSYQSDSMQFIKTLLNQPGRRQQQLELRGTWWDKDFIDLAEQAEFKQAEIKHDPYVYFSYPPHPDNA